MCVCVRNWGWGEQDGEDRGGKGAAHTQRCLPGQDRRVTLDTDDLEYESMYAEEEEDDYDEVLEMDSSEHPRMGGEIPCACLASRMEHIAGNCWAAGALLGRRLHGLSGSRSLHPPAGVDLGFAAL